ncbi:sensor histidine kinase [Pseudonocardia sp. S2-4]|uniref:histidine kinase n=1 Tax=Pseudonocardia humida TaxID=2800819 RepID=A0ABT0ZZ09_9PSEU|nr:sensor histidine kinase [Pseudonocardia humida]
MLAPLRAGLTYRRAVHLLLGAVLLLPYLALGVLFASALGQGGADPVSLGLLMVLAVGAAVGVALVPGVRALEITAARALLGAEVPEPDPATEDAWPARRRAAAWLLVNMAVGGVAGLLVFFVLPSTVGLLLAPWLTMSPLPSGWAVAWAPFVALALPVLLLHAVSAGGAVLARLAPRLLGPSEAERLVVELDRVRAAERRMAERNRLARELHDSVGHALTVTTLQAGAAARVLDSDPAFVARALEAIAEAGRTALDELDHVLALLRDGATEDTRSPQPDLGDLDGLLEGTRSAGVVVTARVRGDVSAVPAVVSREAFRIVQEGVTNALRHAGRVPVQVRVDVGADRLELELTNPLGPAAPRAGRGGRGLAGMRERVGVLGGELTAGPEADGWRVAVRLPLGGPQ